MPACLEGLATEAADRLPLLVRKEPGNSVRLSPIRNQPHCATFSIVRCVGGTTMYTGHMIFYCGQNRGRRAPGSSGGCKPGAGGLETEAGPGETRFHWLCNW